MVDKVEHSYLETRGLSLHIAHVGKGELGAVLFIHGFPEIWYSWRHQMNAVAKAGFKAIAPDLRSYGLSTQPSETEKTTWEDLVADLLAILNFLSISKEPGRAEADFGRFDVKRLIRTIYILFSRCEIPIAEEGQEIMDLADPSTPLPQWFTEEDLNAYVAPYEKSGFHFPLQMPYRTLYRGTGIADPKIEVPVLLIMGEKD
ncbi:unnamed protein product [Musa acuminata subsp. malaccensis]|uniref:(wild Malaysian banana) hypothetical protein n=1 Tax=Musa acuminata subsp. malaccensis TaxID=214687 RepID=A0A8D7F446_MUSAM|nr:unnamed protein product [Musa acuminata subsp. malaccensis]